ncbi:hypothetical protein L249_0638 [Ophiocordyceps polyrhachis-furcata BCC 54312]|uniref:Uncharacterized protein n=1 Tax=Ophiocordyceps polyrhachis-furcata BCC 54312 TaxID=1330021 RepID=A0A367LFW0_9HYPO|nr:hypothetical protein L249_0638 [Ophiocordyceps polyrhachis-furcata BCC 54312]
MLVRLSRFALRINCTILGNLVNYRSYNILYEVLTDDSIIADGFRPISAKLRLTIKVRLP